MSRPRSLLAVLARILLAVWVGAVAAVAFVAAPLVFAAVPEHVATKEAAARIIGPAFSRVDLFGLLAGLIALGHLATVRGAGTRWRGGVLLAMLGAAALDAFWLAPAITAREEPLGLHHGLAVGLWMLILVGGLVLLGAGPAPRRRGPA